jgi:glycolate oxidase iron-sulfur subunit
MGWVTEWAPTQRELDACVSCGLCLPHCPTFRLTGDEAASPRGRLAAMAAFAEGLAVMDGTFEDIMGYCLQCRACEAVCPSLVPFGRMMEGTRAEITVQRPATARRIRHWLLTTLLGSRPLVRVVSLAAAVGQRLRLERAPLGALRKLGGLRPLPLRRPTVVGERYAAEGASRGTAALLAGCVMDPWFAEVHAATIGLLRAAGYDVVVPEAQTCCGALAAHDGAADGARRLAAHNVAAFAGADVVVADAAGCTAHLKDYGHWADGGADLAARVVDVTELVASLIEEGALPALDRDGPAVAVQDPCHLRHAQRITAAPRAIVAAAGHRVVEIDPVGLCCGAAGAYTLLEPEASDELGRRKADQVRRSGSTVVASANPGCEMQLRAHLGPAFEVRHPVELYWAALQAAR